MDEGGVSCYNGDYDYFLSKHNSTDSVILEKKVSAAALDYKEQKRLESEKRKIQTKINRCEDEISQTEQKIEKISEELQTPEIASDYEKAFELSNEVNELNKKLEELYKQWEELNSTQI